MDRVASRNCGSATGIRFLLILGQPYQEVWVFNGLFVNGHYRAKFIDAGLEVMRWARSWRT